MNASHSRRGTFHKSLLSPAAATSYLLAAFNDSPEAFNLALENVIEAHSATPARS